MAAARLPRKTDEEKRIRQEAMEKANKDATLVPLGVLRRSWDAAQVARQIVEKGNRNSVSDAGVAALTARAAAEGAYLNVRINLPGIMDQDFKAATLKEVEEVRKKVIEHTEETVRLAEKTIAEGEDS
jgi:glutamate formiminotransferase/formiminotetrahydrofolate cyclodeaminase